MVALVRSVEDLGDLFNKMKIVLQKISNARGDAVLMGILKPVFPDGREMQQSLWSLFAYKTSLWRLF